MNPFLFRQFRRLETKVHELNYLFWECTQRCNLSCRHCGSDCFTSAKDQDMPLEDFLKALDTIPNPFWQNTSPKSTASRTSPVKLAESDSRTNSPSRKDNIDRLIVVLTGGEPLLRPDIEQVGKEIAKRGYYWSMVSNGFFYTEQMHRKLMAAGLKAITFSLDGIGENHNWMRGNPNSYEHTIKAIEIAAKERTLDLDVVSCINRRSIGQLEEIYQKLKSLGVRKWRLFTIIPIGRAKDDPQMHLTNEEMVRLMDFIAAKRQQKGPLEVSFSCEGYLGKYEEKVRPVRHFCHAGINIASVLIDGRICACPNIDRNVFSQGNIYTDNLFEVWENKFQAFRNRDWARKGICAGCKQFKNCLGGGMHNWHSRPDGSTSLSDLDNPLSCHYHRTGGR
ncbi:MAG: radical SAM protein [Bacteroidales bacterium]|nr:radical SAM protein [Bacteroidales bacterium]